MLKPGGKPTLPQILGMAGIAGAGFVVIIFGLVVMNRISHAPEPEEQTQAVSFTVPPPPPPPPPERREPPQRQPRQTTQRNLAPAPDLGANLSGIAVSIPDFEASGVQTVADSLLGDLDNVALTEDAVDQPPEIRTRIPPEYPERAQQREIEGRVVVAVLVGVDGQVQQLQINESTPPGVFDDAVLAAVRQWTFEPAQYQGNPVETWVNIPIPFSLQ